VLDDEELVGWLETVTDGLCTREKARQSWREVTAALGYRARQPTVYTFLRRFLRWTGWTHESFSFANYIVELAIVHCFGLEFRPQVIAAAAAALSRQYLSQGAQKPPTTTWKKRLLRCAHVDLHRELAPCAVALARLHGALHRQPNMFVNRKYALARFHSVAGLAPALAPPDVAAYARYLQDAST